MRPALRLRFTAAATTAAVTVSALLAGCAAPRHTSVQADVRVAPGWTPLPPPPPPAPVVSVYVEPPLVQPEPVLIDVAPPPMLVEVPPPQPFPGAVWTGGYWGWQGRWVWCAGRWSPPPRPDYVWVQPYYEHRDGAVVFVSGFWAAHGVAFVPPPPGLHLSVQVAIGGGVRPVGPMGVFVPPPPGSRAGLIVPAPVGTPPAVVVSAPAVTRVGMRVQQNTTINNVDVHNTTNVRNVTNITNVTIVAPPGTTANGQAYEGHVPAAAHLAAAMPAAEHAPRAPVPVAAASVSNAPPLPMGHAQPAPAQALAPPHQSQPQPQPQQQTQPQPKPQPQPQPQPLAHDPHAQDWHAREEQRAQSQDRERREQRYEERNEEKARAREMGQANAQAKAQAREQAKEQGKERDKEHEKRKRQQEEREREEGRVHPQQ